ncbi:ketoacyl-ACP synthase III [Bacteroides oleiciplenus]|uniref:Ketoacyl-ACP synthase III n=1 Tax=Bacteroides oleiciplenus TaxID=626931 RepID=A0A3E5B6T5_9BACE|nr:ketoacyl-ACP synthase III [Bacteroides oleiciplenus]RGN33229.1 ketoacyl-ACP synthase III [Bacteroides oleiciplenus]
MKAYIQSISYYLPEKLISNESLVKNFPEWNAEKVASKTGINYRHVAACEETATDMAIKAAEKLFDENIGIRDKIDFILFCTQSPDYKLPTSACIIQDRLKMSSNIGALDYNLGCSGYIYGLSLAKGLIFSGIAKNILLLTSETYNKYIHSSDKGNRSLFGDGAAATLISLTGIAEIGDFVLGTDGSGADNLIIKTGGARCPQQMNDLGYDEGGYVQSSDYLYMNGSEIFNFTLRAVPPLIDAVLARNHVDKENIALFVFHQANKFMLNTIRKVCTLPEDKFYIDLECVGNTVSSTLPIALKDCLKKKLIIPQDKVVVAGFGVGYSWGGTVLDFNF